MPIFEEIVSVGYENQHIKIKQFSIAQRESEGSLDPDYKETWVLSLIIILKKIKICNYID